MKIFFTKNIYKYLFIFFVLPFFSYAQNVDISFAPVSPLSGQTVTVSLRSVDVDLNNTEITWYKDGKKEKTGNGLRDFSFVLSNKTTPIRAVIDNKTSTIERFVNINPTQVDVLWEVVGGHKPPFYKGKVLPVKTSSIKVTAIPQVENEKGLIPDPKTFVYSWQRDGSNAPGQSGYGKNSLIFTPNILNTESQVAVSVSNQAYSVNRSVALSYFNPSIHMYEYNNVYGPLYNKAIKNNQKLSSRSFNIIAEPYFIKRDISDASVVSVWKVNDRNTEPLEKNLLLLNIAENVSSFKVGVKFDLQGELLQGTERFINLSI